MNLTVDDLYKVIGMKEVELAVLRIRLQQLEEQLKKEAPKVDPGPTN